MRDEQVWCAAAVTFGIVALILGLIALATLESAWSFGIVVAAPLGVAAFARGVWLETRSGTDPR